jgi:transcription initiation factor TFIIIB Brf1 subunit/transcription initiation factor TFIIB
VSLSGDVEGRAIRSLQKAHFKRLTVGKDPRGAAAARLYIASKPEIKKTVEKEIALAAGITQGDNKEWKERLVDRAPVKYMNQNVEQNQIDVHIEIYTGRG